LAWKNETPEPFVTPARQTVIPEYLFKKDVTIQIPPHSMREASRMWEVRGAARLGHSEKRAPGGHTLFRGAEWLQKGK
jgi:hypothetical protein